MSEMIREVRAAGLEDCATLGMLKPEQAQELKTAGLDYDNHNLDTSPEYYDKIITTRTYQDRLEDARRRPRRRLEGVLRRHRWNGREPYRIARCSCTPSPHLPEHPESVPINQFVGCRARRCHERQASTRSISCADRGRTNSHARAHVRFSAGRRHEDEAQVLCFIAGANSIFDGEKLLTTGNPDVVRDQELFARLGLRLRARRLTLSCGTSHAPACNHEHAEHACNHEHAAHALSAHDAGVEA